MQRNCSEENGLREIQMGRGNLNPWQRLEMREVAAVHDGENSGPGAEFVTSNRGNSSADTEMQRAAANLLTSIPGKLLPENKLDACERGEEGEKEHEKREKTISPCTLVRWLRFNCVGGIGIVVQLVVLFLLKSIFHFNYLAATALAVEAAVVHNFLWHERFTWNDRVIRSWRRSLPRLLRFNLTTGAISIIGNLVLMKAMVGFGHVNYLAANGIAIVLCSVMNFLVSDQWVFDGGVRWGEGQRGHEDSLINRMF